jgi:hypothetical protein
VTSVGEVVGPPASGKSTVHRALDGAGIRAIGNYLSVRRVPAWATSAIGIRSVLREAIRAGFTRRQLTWIVRLQATPSALRRAELGARAVVFDQGPVYALARLGDAIASAGEPASLRAWWTARLRWWAERLDLVVSLDAPDDVLLRRIRSRDKEHPLRGLGDAEAASGLATERARTDAVVEAIAAMGRSRIERIDGSMTDAAQVVERIRQALLTGATR